MTSREEVADAVFVYPCPSQYCRCFDLYKGSPSTCTFVYNSEEPDSQCHCNRQGKEETFLKIYVNSIVFCMKVDSLKISF